jgi:hypothetical protein
MQGKIDSEWLGGLGGSCGFGASGKNKVKNSTGPKTRHYKVIKRIPRYARDDRKRRRARLKPRPYTGYGQTVD